MGAGVLHFYNGSVLAALAKYKAQRLPVTATPRAVNLWNPTAAGGLDAPEACRRSPKQTWKWKRSAGSSSTSNARHQTGGTRQLHVLRIYFSWTPKMRRAPFAMLRRSSLAPCTQPGTATLGSHRRPATCFVPGTCARSNWWLATKRKR